MLKRLKQYVLSVIELFESSQEDQGRLKLVFKKISRINEAKERRRQTMGKGNFNVKKLLVEVILAS